MNTTEPQNTVLEPANANYETQKAWYQGEMERLLKTVKSAEMNRVGRTDFLIYKKDGWRAKFFTDNGKEVMWYSVSGYPSRHDTEMRALVIIGDAHKA